MRQDKFSKTHLTLYACGIIPVVWLALLLAPYYTHVDACSVKAEMERLAA